MKQITPQQSYETLLFCPPFDITIFEASSSSWPVIKTVGG